MVEFILCARDQLATEGDPARAAKQQAYMKSSMPYHGVATPAVRKICKGLLAQHPMPDRAHWEQALREGWAAAQFREEWYVVLSFLRAGAYRQWRDLDCLRLVKDLATAGAWWDVVDDLAHVVAEVRLAEPDATALLLRQWAVEDNVWVRRMAIIGQLRAKERTDEDLLTDVIESNIADREFFIRKAIGWALRDYAWTNPQWVRAFVREHPQLSPLSQREALKNIGAGE